MRINKILLSVFIFIFSVTSAGAVALRWDPAIPEENVLGYYLYIQNTTKNTEVMHSFLNDGTYTLEINDYASVFIPGDVYTFQLVAYNVAGTSDRSIATDPWTAPAAYAPIETSIDLTGKVPPSQVKTITIIFN